MPLDDRAIAISATFTAEAIEPGLAFWVQELGLDYEIRFGGYNQLFQELLDPSGLFARNRGGFNVALVRFDDWLRGGDLAGLEDHARRLAEAVRSAAERSSAPLILAICPSTPEHGAKLEVPVRVLSEGVADLPAVHLITAAEVLTQYPVDEVHDRHGDKLGHVPYTPLFFVALATAVARRIHAMVAPPFKVIALDCDDTLWAGICGEDGPRNVGLDQPRRALQEFMADQRRSGMLLALCSKNNEADVVETFQAHPEMPLGFEDFVARRINWDAKSANLASLAGDLELGLDSFILVDDNPKECSEAQLGAPEVLALPLPARVEEIPEFLRHVWAFDRTRITEEDRRRPELYAQRAARAMAERSAVSLEGFLASLELEVTITPLEPDQVARVAQLTQRTNQMNATCVRRTEAEIQDLRDLECLTVRVKDRFGSYGLTGAIIFRVQGVALIVDTFLLSCRALGRGVEHSMVAHLSEIAKARGLARVEIPFVAGQRNRPAALFLESLGKAGSDGVFQLSVEDAAGVRYRVGQAVPPALPSLDRENVRKDRPQAGVTPHEAGGTACPTTLVTGTRGRVDYLRIANELRHPTAILDRIRAISQHVAPHPSSPDLPRTPLERELSEIWAGLLNLPSVGVHDNFFEFGGHSLLAVQLLSRVRQIYGVDLSLEVVYSGEFTVAELAKAVELKEIEQGGADYQDLLQELEGLSDEEVRAMLAEEQDAS
ncbi:MAG TPA: HAD-IIIC family phosphatase [Bryobacteraceae bacterium]|jgi:FkbH-like protein|nr:HAD-IIIC family phosphatase [Bryobacteraceae bacterium]